MLDLIVAAVESLESSIPASGSNLAGRAGQRLRLRAQVGQGRRKGFVRRKGLKMIVMSGIEV